MNDVCIIIAEAGVNHNGSYAIARDLVYAAARAGAGYVKFQTFKSNKLVSKYAKQAEYQIKNSRKSDNLSQLSMLKKLELDEEMHRKLILHAEECDIGFLSTAFDLDSIELLAQYKLDYWKVPSGEISNLPYLEKVGSYGGSVIMSTGMATIDEIEAALNILISSGTPKDNITVLHCNTEYPTPIEDVNLRAMESIKNTFDVKVGYSDHTLGIEIPIAAVALGASTIEKHLTLDQEMEGPDHKASLNPDQLSQMVQGIRKTEKALGDGKKRPSQSEIKNKTAARKSIIAACPIRKGDVYTEANICIKRPGNGISPMDWYSILGQRANRNYQADELIER